MEKTVRRTKIPVYLVIIILVVILAAAAGIYFLTGGAQDKKPSRGTYVMTQLDKEYTL